MKKIAYCRKGDIVTTEIPLETDFRSVLIKRNTEIVIRDMDLSRWAFAETAGVEDPNKFRFFNVSWTGKAPKKSIRKNTRDEDNVEKIVTRGRRLRAFLTQTEKGDVEYKNALKGMYREEIFEIRDILKTAGINILSREAILKQKKGIKKGFKNSKPRRLIEATETTGEVYRRLRLNYESRLAYEAASDFHIGQMEMLLTNPATPVFKKFFLRWYRRLSNFGESVELPLLWFLLLWAIFTAIWLVVPLVAPVEDILAGHVTTPWKLWGYLNDISWVEVT